MSRTGTLLAAASIAALTGLGCGGDVVVQDGDGSGGAGSGSSSNKGSSGTSSDIGFGCQLMCVKHPECIDPTNCPTTCQQVYVAGCEDQADALMVCLADAFGSDCSLGLACVSELQSYGICVGTAGTGPEPPQPPDPPQPG